MISVLLHQWRIWALIPPLHSAGELSDTYVLPTFINLSTFKQGEAAQACSEARPPPIAQERKHSWSSCWVPHQEQKCTRHCVIPQPQQQLWLIIIEFRYCSFYSVASFQILTDFFIVTFHGALFFFFCTILKSSLKTSFTFSFNELVKLI